MKIAKVLFTHAAIPNDGFVSWPQRLEYILQEYKDNKIDYLVCKHTSKPLHSTTKRILCQEPSKVYNKVFEKKRFKSYEQALADIAAKHDHVIACVVDSAKMKNGLADFVKDKGLEKKVKLVYYQCGFSNYYSTEEHNRFATGLSELILLSHHSYKFEFDRYPDMPYPVHVLHNPINHQIFKPLAEEERIKLRSVKKMGDTVQFIWVSHDKPVKGLTVILEAWKLFYDSTKNAVLHIIGAKREEKVQGVIFHGKISNKDLPEWYQSCDINIFSPMRNEGYGLALAEALSCGCMCISTYAGGAVDFFKEEEHGIAIMEPNFLHVWAAAFDQAIEKLPAFQALHKNDYLKPPAFATYDEWCANFLAILGSIEKRLA